MDKKIYEKLMKKHGCVAVGRGRKIKNGVKTDIRSYVCSVPKKFKAADIPTSQLIPKQIGGLPTDVIETGILRIPQPAILATQAADIDPTQRIRPAPGGVSVGHYAITAGTLGCWVKNSKGQWVILSNNHVLANSNAASIGDAILQPGSYDGGSLQSDRIATLEDFVKIIFGDDGELPSQCPIAAVWVGVGNFFAWLWRRQTRIPQAIIPRAAENLVDCAIARAINDEDVDPTIAGVGPVASTISPAYVGMEVQKYGRTTAYNTGEVLQVDVAANVQYGEGQVALFTDQVLLGPMSQGGDSGSLILDMHNCPTALLFAGSDQVTIANRIENVIEALGIQFA